MIHQRQYIDTSTGGSVSEGGGELTGSIEYQVAGAQPPSTEAISAFTWFKVHQINIIGVILLI